MILRITIDDADVLNRINEITTRAQQLRPAMKNIGEYMLLTTRGRFDKEEAPDGTPWAPLKNKAAAFQKKSGQSAKVKSGKRNRKPFDRFAANRKILQDTKLLRDTINYQVNDNTIRIRPQQQYGKYHQYGTSPYVIRPKNKRFLAFPAGDGSTIFTKRVNHPGLPARPFLGINEADIREINQIVSDHIFGQ
jgi:phage gpG-like protein